MKILIINVQETCLKVRQLIESCGYKPKDISQKLGINVQTVYKWYATAKNKNKRLPPVQHMINLARLLGVKLEDMYVCDEISIKTDSEE